MTGKELKVINFDEMAMTPETAQNQVNLIQLTMKQVMKEGEHYGKIPGCGDKPALLKPGAEKLSTTFRLAPSYEITRTELDKGHREYEIICTLKHIPTDQIVGEGVGLCTSMESKYRWREQSKKCPKCQAEAIISGNPQYNNGVANWICWKKKGGCGFSFNLDDPSITGQPTGRIENEDIADTFNTVLKMAKKRAHVDAVLTATAASDIFTQDIEDIKPQEKTPAPAPTGKATKPSTKTKTRKKPSSKSAAPQNQDPGPQQEPGQQEPTTAEMRMLLEDGMPTEPEFAPFLISKKWLEEGKVVTDLSDNQVERLYNNWEQMKTIYIQWKEANNG